MPKIIIAFCEELQRSISIDTARSEYFSFPENQRKRFTFSVVIPIVELL